MIIARISAGLGNQLFQYAAARELGAVLGTEVRLDAHTWFSHRSSPHSLRREYLLPQLGLPLVEASAVERQAPFRRCWLGWRQDRADWTYLRQKDAAVPLAAFRQARSPVFLDGYWQSEEFFPTCKVGIARELVSLRPGGSDAARWLDAVSVPGTVAVHVRRGDYVAESTRSPGLRLLDAGHYRAALARLRMRTEICRAVVFSDDPQWCRAHLQLGIPTLLVPRDDPQRTTVDDLLCLAHATNLLTANSTFSWWAAWIATQRGEARVVAPARWFNDPDYSLWSERLCVPGWETV